MQVLLTQCSLIAETLYGSLSAPVSGDFSYVWTACTNRCVESTIGMREVWTRVCAIQSHSNRHKVSSENFVSYCRETTCKVLIATLFWARRHSCGVVPGLVAGARERDALRAVQGVIGDCDAA